MFVALAKVVKRKTNRTENYIIVNQSTAENLGCALTQKWGLAQAVWK